MGPVMAFEEYSRVRLGRVVRAFALGVPATLVAHALSFGADHEVGGRFNGAVFSIAIVALAGFVLGCVAVAWRGRTVADGSILACRLRGRLPATSSIFLSAAVLFAGCELLEPAHGFGNVLVIAGLLVACSWCVRATARVIASVIALATVAIESTRFDLRPVMWRAFYVGPVLLAISVPARFPFVRPPPVNADLLRA